MERSARFASGQTLVILLEGFINYEKEPMKK